MVVAIGPKAGIQKHQDVLFEIGGENVIFIEDYASIDEHTDDIMRLICRKFSTFYLSFYSCYLFYHKYFITDIWVLFLWSKLAKDLKELPNVATFIK